jgi:hypothetical protein
VRADFAGGSARESPLAASRNFRASARNPHLSAPATCAHSKSLKSNPIPLRAVEQPVHPPDTLIVQNEPKFQKSLVTPDTAGTYNIGIVQDMNRFPLETRTSPASGKICASMKPTRAGAKRTHRRGEFAPSQVVIRE